MKIEHDGPLDISTGRSRTEKRWKNEETLWSSLITRTSKTHRTTETYAEYMKSKPGRQDAIKDIGGFVGGMITGGRRKNGSVVHRSLLTLDLDFAPSTTDVEEAAGLLGFGCAGYSTHKHSSGAPRLRLMFPLDRTVSPDEYEAIARKLASWMDIEWFDPTTYQPTRLMYWPSTSKDGEFWSWRQDAEWLSADMVLASYADWQDATQWPIGSKEREKVKSDIDKQGDPLVKSGIVGAWCRTYTITDAIEKHLSDVYLATDDPTRWTYAGGTTAAGLVVYDDVFAYSHHSSDPISEKTCNAFDLVRLHKFAHLDEKHEAGEKGAKLPSYVAMADMASADKAVRRTIGEEKVRDAQETFAETPEVVAGAPASDMDDKAWMEEMEVDGNSNYLLTINNVVLVLENDPGLKGKFTYDLFEHQETLEGDLPWRKLKRGQAVMKDTDVAALRHYMETIYGLTGERKIDDALSVVQQRHAYHPVRDWLDSLVWDEESRAERLFIDYLGAEPTEYVRMVTRKALLACVTRIYEPGRKFDEIVTLVGGQGIGKSTILDKLGRQWFSDSLTDIRGTSALEQLQGAWIIEMGELDAMRKAELSAFKHFVAKRNDRFRVAYGKRVEKFPRQCVFFGTIDEWEFLKDAAGDRRFWPVACERERAWKSVFNDLTPEVVAQVWAEVCSWYMQDETLFLDERMRKLAEKTQASHRVVDDRVGMIESYLERMLPVDWKDKSVYDRREWLQLEQEDLTEKGEVKRMTISIPEIWCELFNGTMRDLTTYNSKDLSNLMKRVSGWTLTGKKLRLGQFYGMQRVYERKQEA